MKKLLIGLLGLAVLAGAGFMVNWLKPAEPEYYEFKVAATRTGQGLVGVSTAQEWRITYYPKKPAGVTSDAVCQIAEPSSLNSGIYPGSVKVSKFYDNSRVECPIWVANDTGNEATYQLEIYPSQGLDKKTGRIYEPLPAEYAVWIKPETMEVILPAYGKARINIILESSR